MSKAKAHYETWGDRMRAMKGQAPEIGQGFAAMYGKLMVEGALSKREKELIAIAIGMAVHCDPCIYAHVEAAVKAGATREQLLDMAGVVVAMMGGPGYVQVPELIDAMEALGV